MTLALEIAFAASIVVVGATLLGVVFSRVPERLLVGTGAYGQLRPDPGTLETLRARGVEVEVLGTAEAIQRYAQLDPRKTAAALHLTC